VRPLLRFLLTSFLLVSLAGSALAVAPLRPFCAPRFGFCVSVPGELKPDPPPDNGDGQSWHTADGRARVVAYGSFSPDVFGLATIKAYADWLKAGERQAGSRLTYAFVGRDQVVLSGYRRSGRLFYERARLRAGTESVVSIEYAPGLKTTWDRLSVRIAATLTPPRPS